MLTDDKGARGSFLSGSLNLLGGGARRAGRGFRPCRCRASGAISVPRKSQDYTLVPCGARFVSTKSWVCYFHRTTVEREKRPALGGALACTCLNHSLTLFSLWFGRFARSLRARSAGARPRCVLTCPRSRAWCALPSLGRGSRRSLRTRLMVCPRRLSTRRP